MDDDEDIKKRMERERAAREAGIERAYQAANEQWKEDALEAVEYIAERQAELMSYDVWQRLEQVTDFVPREGRAMSGVLRRAQSKGWIANTGQMKQSRKPGNHLNRHAVWRSLIYGTRRVWSEPLQEQLL